MNYSTNVKVQVSYMMIWERVQADHSSCTVWLPAICWADTIKFPQLHELPDLSRLWAFSLTVHWL